MLNVEFTLAVWNDRKETMPSPKGLVSKFSQKLSASIYGSQYFLVLFCSADTMDTYISLLQTYTGRDKILRTVGYAASLISGFVANEKKAEKFVTVSRQISNSRVVLRFFDDILMWRITRHWSVEVYCIVFMLRKFHLLLFYLWYHLLFRLTDCWHYVVPSFYCWSLVLVLLHSENEPLMQRLFLWCSWSCCSLQWTNNSKSNWIYYFVLSYLSDGRKVISMLGFSPFWAMSVSSVSFHLNIFRGYQITIFCQVSRRSLGQEQLFAGLWVYSATFSGTTFACFHFSLWDLVEPPPVFCRNIGYSLSLRKLT